jgi:hypothetical protein
MGFKLGFLTVQKYFFSGRKDYLIGQKRVENLSLSGFTKHLSFTVT